MIKVFSDSTTDLTKELYERYDITVLPLHIVLNDKEYRDGLDITPDDIFKWSDENKTTPKTSAASVEDCMEAFKKVLDNGDEIIAFAISEELSTTANSMRLAAAELDASDRVSVIDSRSLSTGIGLQVLEAAVKVKEGTMTRQEIVDYVTGIIPRVSATFVVDTLTFLHRGGRCSAVAALAGSILKLHPEIIVTNGKMIAGRKFRGQMTKVIEEYVKGQEAELLKAKSDYIFITHSGQVDEGLEFTKNYLKSLNRFENIVETRAGGVISSHCGPGTLGILYIKSE